MASYTVFTLEASEISISGGASLSGITQGDGSHLMSQTITLNSNDWQSVQVSDDDANFNDSEGGQVLDGAQTYDGVSHASGLRVEAEYTLTVQDPDGNTYTLIGFNINEAGGGASYGTVEGVAFVGGVGGFPPQGVPLVVIATSEGPAGSSTPYSGYATPPCFTPGTLIDTPSGPRLVEELKPGDLVQTVDHGAQPVHWVGRTDLSGQDLWLQPRLRPVHVAANAFAPGMPARDMQVSPQHRILMSCAQTQLYFGAEEALVPAAFLVNGTSIRQQMRSEGVCYLHIAFARHEVVMSDGIATESFLPGAMAVSGLEASVRAELESLFPGCGQEDDELRAARICVKGPAARLLKIAA